MIYLIIEIFSASISLIDIMPERVKEITFNDEYPEQFALTTDYHVLFLTWVDENASLFLRINYIYLEIIKSDKLVKSYDNILNYNFVQNYFL